MESSKHPLKGTPVKFVSVFGDTIDAFVADIDDDKGFTLHALDKEEARKLNATDSTGELWCVNFKQCASPTVKEEKRAYKLFIEMIKTGVFDAAKAYEQAGKKRSATARGVSCFTSGGK